MNSKFDNLENCTLERLLQINKQIRAIRKTKQYPKDVLEELKKQRTQTDQLLSAIKQSKQMVDDNEKYETLKQEFIQAKIS